MSVAGGPNLIKSGLVLELDAGNIKSYQSSSTTWFDKSGNTINGTLTNGPMFDTGSGGSIKFDGINDYVTLPTSSIVAFGTGSFTTNAWYSLSSTSAPLPYSCIWDMGGSNTAFGGVYSNRFSNNTLLYYANGIRLEPSVTQTTNTWYYITLVCSGGTTVAIYLNGNLLQSNTYNYNFTSQNWMIGTNQSYFPEVMNGKIPIFSVYNRALSTSEIQQNYNALKTRFGL
jgi:hypothetical protein